VLLLFFLVSIKVRWVERGIGRKNAAPRLPRILRNGATTEIPTAAVPRRRRRRRWNAVVRRSRPLSGRLRGWWRKVLSSGKGKRLVLLLLLLLK
jgi:hypothetical protein